MLIILIIINNNNCLLIKRDFNGKISITIKALPQTINYRLHEIGVVECSFKLLIKLSYTLVSDTYY